MDAYHVDLIKRRHERFTLWVPASEVSTTPKLVLGLRTNSNSFQELARLPMNRSADKTDLWELEPKTITPPLADGAYRYWFEVLDTSPEKRGTILVTDPLAFTVDYALTQGSGEQLQPATVIKYRNGKLWPCDLDGTEPSRPPVPDQGSLPSNNHLVIYELPTSWCKVGSDRRGVHVDVGTFADVKALFDSNTQSANFASIHEPILSELGINALELLPAADAKNKAEWGYATAHYFAPDSDLGSASDLVSLVETLQTQNIRLFTDVVMAFGHDPYSYIAFRQFHLRPNDEKDNPDSYQSYATGALRDGYGGQSWRYKQQTRTYDPESGVVGIVSPAWSFHKAHLARWMLDFSVTGLRLDSINNVGRWDFVRSYKERAWELYNARYGPAADASKFLVIGEELSMPVSMVHRGVVNALWNEPWQGRLRALLVGESRDGDNFEWTVRKVADTTLVSLDGTSFTDGAQAVNYITSHDIEGYRKERLYNFLSGNGLSDSDVGRRAKLAFALLLTSVGIPMIFAGEEFADQMDRSVNMAKKQSDPVNYARKDDGEWRAELFKYVANLVKFRTKCPALGEDDTDFFHVDQGGKIMAWRRGRTGEGRMPVVVVANFTDRNTEGERYVIPNWPSRELDGWREVSQKREVPTEWVGREPLMAWEAKMYTRWRE
ncbi:putative alpha amylase, catalytic domain subfamily [Coniochaeta sp. 2T2.1]|nr:putative alpha amylase, catalytic domain subfamily [Coniochaeta sp. 2T2.1]